MRFVSSIALAAVLVACGGGSAPDGGKTRFLLLAHQPLGGDLAAASDAQLLDIGTRACTEMDTGTPSDRIVADIGNDPEPGSASFNAYSYVVVAAATQLCPEHKSEFSGGLTP